MIRRCKRCSFGNVGEGTFCAQCGIQLPPATWWRQHNTLLTLSIIGGFFALCGLCGLLGRLEEKSPNSFSSSVSSPTPPSKSPSPSVSPNPIASPSPTTIVPKVETAKSKETKTQNQNSVIPPTVEASETKTKSTAPKSKPRLSSAGGYIRGPRGGCYYYSSGGSKVYVDRSLCN